MTALLLEQQVSNDDSVSGPSSAEEISEVVKRLLFSVATIDDHNNYRHLPWYLPVMSVATRLAAIGVRYNDQLLSRQLQLVNHNQQQEQAEILIESQPAGLLIDDNGNRIPVDVRYVDKHDDSNDQ